MVDQALYLVARSVRKLPPFFAARAPPRSGANALLATRRRPRRRRGNRANVMADRQERYSRATPSTATVHAYEPPYHELIMEAPPLDAAIDGSGAVPEDHHALLMELEPADTAERAAG